MTGTEFRNSSFVYHRTKSVIWVWNTMRVSQYLVSIQFGSVTLGTFPFSLYLSIFIYPFGWSGPDHLLLNACWWQTVDHACWHMLVNTYSGGCGSLERLLAVSASEHKYRPSCCFQPQNKSISHQCLFVLRVLLEEDLKSWALTKIIFGLVRLPPPTFSFFSFPEMLYWDRALFQVGFETWNSV